jgi:EAL domain-containing protein (putative c-di-GMP-specific phosphodiesterase class I)
MALAEETGFIVPIGHWVLLQACRQMKLWQEKYTFAAPLSISINLSGRQFTHSNLLEQITQILDATRLDPHSLKLEITESIVMDSVESAPGTLEKLRAIGVELSIDDFGTGYSSLSYLHRLPIDTLKIDRSFVSQMGENSENIEIVRTIIMLARNLGMGVVAEGVETKGQLDLLRELGCESVQGFLVSRPLDVDSVEKLIVRASSHLQESLLDLTELHEKDSFQPLVSTYSM